MLGFGFTVLLCCLWKAFMTCVTSQICSVCTNVNIPTLHSPSKVAPIFVPVQVCEIFVTGHTENL